MLEAVRRYESTGRTEAAHRVLQSASQVFWHAVALQMVKAYPTRDLRGELVSHRAKHHAANLEPKKAGELLRAIDGFDGSPVVHIALKRSALLFVRPGELRHAEWAEIDTDAAVWRIPGPKMKGRIEHAVPLAMQSLIEHARSGFVTARAVLAQATTGTGDDFDWKWEKREWVIPNWFWSIFTKSGRSS